MIAIWLNAAEAAFDYWLELYRVNFPKAIECLEKERSELLVFHDFPAELELSGEPIFPIA